MKYRLDKYGNRLSALGYGCMRLTSTAGRVDVDKAEKEMMAAYRAGVNYFDTAYIYPGSEDALGQILQRNNIRDKVNIATKLPHYLIKNHDSLDKYFLEELRRLRTDHVEYYLMHMLTDIATWERLKALGIVEWLEEKKRSGQIGQVGFSYHGNSDMFCELVDAYDWDFCQIQYNYLDEHTQAGRKGLQYANSKGLPVIIMEPLRGGRLVNRLPAEAKRIFERHSVSHTPAQWAFRWLWDQPEVTVVLSGMNSLEMVEDNTATAADADVGALTQADKDMLADVVKAINATMKVGCTGCRYCVPCPKGVDIPAVFAAYNRLYSETRFSGQIDYIMCTTMRKNSTAASQCIGCGRCESHCPQHIPIRQELVKARKELEGPMYKIASKAVKVLKLYG